MHDFPRIVRHGLEFLADYGFTEVMAQPTVVVFQRVDVQLKVYYECKSHEVGLSFRLEGQEYLMSHIIYAEDPKFAERYRDPWANTEESLSAAVALLASLLRKYGTRALQCDHQFFAQIWRDRSVRINIYSLESVARQIRPKAEAAFREGRYLETIDLYEQILPVLSSVERAKLAAARKRR